MTARYDHERRQWLDEDGRVVLSEPDAAWFYDEGEWGDDQ